VTPPMRWSLPVAAQAGQPQARFLRAMDVMALDQVMAVEVQAYAFPWSRGNFVDSLAAGYLALCLVTPQGELLGYLVAMPGFEEWHLLNIAVAPGHQGQGHALALLDALKEQAQRTRAGVIWLEVRPSNQRARQIYERYGFVQVGRRKDYYPDHGGQREDALVLRYGVALPPEPSETP
jgi:ribosomal-protein-alanine N-acetyltransferase